MKLKGEKAHTVNRPELVAKYGYDTKFAMHALNRLGFEGIELDASAMKESGAAPFDLAGRRTESGRCAAVRTGQVGFSEALKLIEDAEARLTELVRVCPWKADIDGINRFMVWAHTEHWRAHGVAGLAPALTEMQ